MPIQTLPKICAAHILNCTSVRFDRFDLFFAGADVETRQEIFEQLLPEETFVDRRLMTEAL